MVILLGLFCGMLVGAIPLYLPGLVSAGIGSDLEHVLDGRPLSLPSLFIDNGGVIRTGLYSDASGTAGNIDITAGQIEIGKIGGWDWLRLWSKAKR